MAVTTFHSIREAQYEAIKGITPTSLSDVRFVALEEDVDDPRVWLAEHPQASLRRFAINFLSEEIDGPVLDTERVYASAELIVGYSRDAKYGTPKKRMREKVMAEDRLSLEGAALLLARMYGNLSVDATVVNASQVEIEPLGPGVVAMVLPYTVAFSRSTDVT